MAKKSVAFYLVGQSTRREPRLIELQHVRIQRYRDLARHPDEDPFASPKVFIDLNQHRRRYPTREYRDEFHQFYALLAEIGEAKIGIVYTDIRENQAPTVDYSWVGESLRNAGASVINIYYDEDCVFDGALKEKYGQDASVEDIDDSSDFVCFFPKAAHSIVRRVSGKALRSEPTLNVDFYRQQLADLNPYATGRTPFVEPLLADTWKEQRSNRNAIEAAERRKTECLYRIAPDGEGLLRDEGHMFPGPRTVDSLAWAEKRVCENLQFVKVEEGRTISYQRKVEQGIVFADIRIQGSIRFHLFKSERQKRKQVSPSREFSIQDRMKNNSERRWQEAFKATEN